MARSRSSIDKLPEEIRQRLNELLLQPDCTLLQITGTINDLLASSGSDQRVSKSSVGRYSKSVEQLREKAKEQQTIVNMWTSKFGSMPQGQMGNVLIEFLRTMAFDLVMEMDGLTLDEENMAATIAMVNKLALAVQRLESSASLNARREREIRQQEREAAKEDAVKTLEDIADIDTIKRFRKQFL